MTDENNPDWGGVMILVEQHLIDLPMIIMFINQHFMECLRKKIVLVIACVIAVINQHLYLSKKKTTSCHFTKKPERLSHAGNHCKVLWLLQSTNSAEPFHAQQCVDVKKMSPHQQFFFFFVKQRFKNPIIIGLRWCGAPAEKVLVYELLL